MLRRVGTLLTIVYSLIGTLSIAQEHKSPPVTRTDNVTETIHGVSITDPYRWLEDQNSAETRAWIKAQNDYTKALLGAFPGRDRIRSRVEQLLKVDTINPPRTRAGRYFFTKRVVGQNQSVIYVRNGIGGKDEVLIDPNPMSPDQTTSVNIEDISNDGKLLAYGIRQGGEDEVAVRLLDVDSRKELTDQLPRARYATISITSDRSGFYYSKFTREGPRLHYHAMRANPSSDTEIFGKGYGPSQIIAASVTDDGRYLLITVFHGSAGDKAEVYIQDLASKGPITPIVNDVSANFSAKLAGDQMFLHTNWNAPKGRILAVDLKNPARERWSEVVPEATSVISSFSIIGGKLFIGYLENVSERIKAFEPSGRPLRDIPLPMMGNVGGVIGQSTSDEAFLTFESFAQPTTIYRHQVSTGKQEVWARTNVPIASDQIETKQVWYQSKDKTRIPMFIVHKKGLKLDGARPTLLTGYGGFNVNRTPTFSARAAYWAEQGGVFALPNLRGGGEFGEKWHKAGMLEEKQNVFDDFIAAAEWLIKNNYTKRSKLAISGGSNGGLLVGAAMTQRPELFQAVVCSYPLLDMIRYQNFLVARFWVPEYGSAENPDQFKYIHAYSPYHRVKKGTKYPAVLFITGDADTRVAPLHARKMAALVQASTASDRPVLLHYDTKAGHSRGLPVSKQIEDLADELSFLFWQLGIAG